MDDKGNIYFITGNGSWNGTTQFSESFIKLDPHLHLLDWFTPTNHFQLDKDDNDLNSSGAILIPGTHLVIGGGKEGVLYAINTEHFGHLGDEHAVQHFPATRSDLHSMVYWKSARNGDVLYLWGQRDRARAYRFNGAKFDETPFMIRPDKNDGHPGAMLSLSANGARTEYYGRQSMPQAIHGMSPVPASCMPTMPTISITSFGIRFKTRAGMTAITIQKWRHPQSQWEGLSRQLRH